LGSGGIFSIDVPFYWRTALFLVGAISLTGTGKLKICRVSIEYFPKLAHTAGLVERFAPFPMSPGKGVFFRTDAVQSGGFGAIGVWGKVPPALPKGEQK
jgi:hypothetical protein